MICSVLYSVYGWSQLLGESRHPIVEIYWSMRSKPGLYLVTRKPRFIDFSSVCMYAYTVHNAPWKKDSCHPISEYDSGNCLTSREKGDWCGYPQMLTWFVDVLFCQHWLYVVCFRTETKMGWCRDCSPCDVLWTRCTTWSWEGSNYARLIVCCVRQPSGAGFDWRQQLATGVQFLESSLCVVLRVQFLFVCRGINGID